MPSGSLADRKGKRILRNSFFSAQRCMLVTLISMIGGKEKLFTNKWLSLSVWTGLSTTIKAGRLQIKSYRLSFTFLHSKEYISLTTDLNASDGLELNSKLIDHGLNYRHFILSVKKVLLPLEQWATGVAIMTIMMSMFAKKFQTATALKHRNGKLKFYAH